MRSKRTTNSAAPTTLRQLSALVRKGEGLTLEFKRSTGEIREAMETLCGMLNSSGHGLVLFGVSNQGKLLGQTVSENSLRDISNAFGRIEPTTHFITSTIPIQSNLAVLRVEVSARAPHLFTYEGRGFLRVGNTTQKMSRAEYDRRIVQRADTGEPWDRGIARDWKLRHLDNSEIRRTIDEAIEAKRLRSLPSEKIEVVLRRLKLVTDQGITRAAAILFSKEDGPAFPTGEIRLARFKGISKAEFRDNRQFTGSAFALFQHAERFMEEHVPIASRFEEGRMRRIDTPLYPPLAVREALVNALVHRDYSIDAGAVSVALFDDRLEIISTGKLPHGVTLRKLMGTHESMPRNRLIADVFHRRGLIEKWGRGTNQMVEEAVKHGCPKPEFEESGNSFIVRFKPAAIASVTSEDIEPSSRAKIILEALRKSESMTPQAIRRHLSASIPLRSLQRELQRLQDMGLVVAGGKARAISYRLVRRVKK
jgi:ATP-dependent DNA helicase RecG